MYLMIIDQRIKICNVFIIMCSADTEPSERKSLAEDIPDHISNPQTHFHVSFKMLTKTH